MIFWQSSQNPEVIDSVRKWLAPAPPFKNCKGGTGYFPPDSKHRSKASFRVSQLLTFAGHVVVPVHERALRVIAPGPDVELEE